MENFVTVDSILGAFNEWITNKKVIDPYLWLDAAAKINVLLEDEQNKLFEIQQVIAVQRRILIEQGSTVAKAKVMIEATDEYKQLCKQKAKIDRAIEFGRLAKQQSRTTREIIGGY